MSAVGAIRKKYSFRTRYITVVLEDVYQSQNASAVLRTCDCLGIQESIFIENKNKFNLDKEVSWDQINGSLFTTIKEKPIIHSLL